MRQQAGQYQPIDQSHTCWPDTRQPMSDREQLPIVNFIPTLAANSRCSGWKEEEEEEAEEEEEEEGCGEA